MTRYLPICRLILQGEQVDYGSVDEFFEEIYPFVLYKHELELTRKKEKKIMALVGNLSSSWQGMCSVALQ